MWYNFPGYGDYNLTGVAAAEINATGAHGYPTQALADAHPNASPNAIQAGLLDSFNAASLSPVGAGGISGVLQTPHSTGGVTGAASNIASDIVGSVNAQNLILRIGEVALGIVLIAVGLAKLTGSDNAVSRGVKRLPV